MIDIFIYIHIYIYTYIHTYVYIYICIGFWVNHRKQRLHFFGHGLPGEYVRQERRAGGAGARRSGGEATEAPGAYAAAMPGDRPRPQWGKLPSGDLTMGFNGILWDFMGFYGI